MHERQAIRDAVVAALLGETAAGARVEASRFEPADADELPMVCVYTLEESVSQDSVNTAPRELTRSLRVAIDGYAGVPANGAIDTSLDDLALEIETAMDADLNFGSAVADSILENTEVLIGLAGERPLGCVHLIYAMTYRTYQRIADPDDALDSVDVHYSLSGEQDADDQANDVLTQINQE